MPSASPSRVGSGIVSVCSSMVELMTPTPIVRAFNGGGPKPSLRLSDSVSDVTATREPRPRTSSRTSRQSLKLPGNKSEATVSWSVQSPSRLGIWPVNLDDASQETLIGAEYKSNLKSSLGPPGPLATSLTASPRLKARESSRRESFSTLGAVGVGALTPGDGRLPAPVTPEGGPRTATPVTLNSQTNASQLITLNIGGRIFNVTRTTLFRHPNTRLGCVGTLLRAFEALQSASKSDQQMLKQQQQQQTPQNERTPKKTASHVSSRSSINTAESDEQQVDGGSTKANKKHGSLQSVKPAGLQAGTTSTLTPALAFVSAKANGSKRPDAAYIEKLVSDLCDKHDLAHAYFFFDRDPSSFDAILNFYRNGKLHVPDIICIEQFVDDLHYWGLDTVCTSTVLELIPQVLSQQYNNAELSCIVMSKLTSIQHCQHSARSTYFSRAARVKWRSGSRS